MYIANETDQVARRDIEQVVLESLEDLITYDLILLQNDVSERAITHKLAGHIQKRVPNLDVDCEYNRDVTQGDYKPKMLRVPSREELQNVVENYNLDELISISTYPDIIVHRRGSNAENLLVIEVKKQNSSIRHDHDVEKLSAFTDHEANQYRYKYGVFILLDTRKQIPETPMLQWFVEGARESTNGNV